MERRGGSGYRWNLGRRGEWIVLPFRYPIFLGIYLKKKKKTNAQHVHKTRGEEKKKKKKKHDVKPAKPEFSQRR